jgi:1-acyl-sn-glycerol-3-phosphate acyltransferase
MSVCRNDTVPDGSVTTRSVTTVLPPLDARLDQTASAPPTVPLPDEEDGRVKRQVGTIALRLTGWKVDGSAPAISKYVAIAAPHTSNWDLLYLLMHAWSHDVGISWLAKESVFRGPTGWLLRRLGGIPVQRGGRPGLVESLRAEFARRDELVVVFPPEATRRRSDHWKSGFYQVALAAQVPIVCIYLDYSERIGGFGPTVDPTGDIEDDMDAIRSFYADKRGKFPDQMSDIRLLDGDPSGAS